MSADNYILICKKDFSVYEGCASNDNLFKVGIGKDLSGAVELAEKYEEDLFKHGSYLEYGIHFTNKLRGFNVHVTKTNKPKTS